MQFRMQSIVKEFIGKDGKVTGVILASGEELEAEVCVVGAGVVPATQFILQNKDIQLQADGSIRVDETLKVTENLYAGGDLCRFPYFFTGEHIRVEHYGMAQYHGRVAALNMLGKRTKVESVPFFWTVQYGKSIRYCGHFISCDNIIYDGNLEDLKFAAFFIKNGSVVAAVSVGRDPLTSIVAELLQHKNLITEKDLLTAQQQTPLEQYLQSLLLKKRD